MKKFIPAPGKSYCEIYQDSNLKFAFALESDTELRQVHDFIKCRDFFNEALVATQIGGIDSPSIFGFSYPAKKYPIDLETTRLILKGTRFNEMLKNLQLLNKFERELDLEQTTITAIPDSEHYYLTGDKVWLVSAPMISFYTHILRCIYQYDHDAENFVDFMTKCSEQTGNAAKYQKSINEMDWVLLISRAHDIFPKGTLPLPEMSAIKSVSTVHNYTGIVSWAKDGMYEQYKDSYKKFKELGG